MITAVNILVHVPLWNWVRENSFELYTQKWDLPQGQITLWNAVPVLPPTSKAQGLLFPHNLTSTSTAQLSDLCYSSSGNYKLSLDLHFSDYFLHVLIGPLGFLFGKLPFSLAHP